MSATGSVRWRYRRKRNPVDSQVVATLGSPRRGRGMAVRPQRSGCENWAENELSRNTGCRQPGGISFARCAEEEGARYILSKTATGNASSSSDCRLLLWLFDPVASHAPIALLDQLALCYEQRQRATQVDLRARFRHHVAFAEAGLQCLGCSKRGVLLPCHFVGRCSAAPATGDSSATRGRSGGARPPRPSPSATGWRTCST